LQQQIKLQPRAVEITRDNSTELTFNFIATSVRQGALTVRLVCPPLAKIRVARDKFNRRVQPVFHRECVVALPKLAGDVALVGVDVRRRRRFDESSVCAH
jgi:hypothetical protein